MTSPTLANVTKAISKVTEQVGTLRSTLADAANEASDRNGPNAADQTTTVKGDDHAVS